MRRPTQSNDVLEMPNEKLLGFYRGTSRDDRGRRIDEIWSFSHEQLEAVHDYIQWLFPLAERSAFNPGAPLLDEETIARFHRSEERRVGKEGRSRWRSC